MSDVLRFGKKLFTWSVVAMTIAWSVGLSALVPAAGVQAAVVSVADVEAGDLIKLADQSAVYYINEDMERMYFATDWIHATWLPNFSGIKTLAAGTDLDAHFPPALRGAVGPRPGSCESMKSPASPAVYVVSYGGVRHKLASEAAAVALCGADWARHVHDLPDFIISLFPLGGELNGSAPFPGQLIRSEANGPVYVVGADSKAYLVEGTLPAFLVAAVRTVTQAQWDALAGMGEGTRTVASLTSDVAQLSGEPSGDDDDDVPGNDDLTGDLRVSLAGNSPEMDVVPGGAQNVPYLGVVLQAEDGDVEVESLTFNLGGVGDEDDFDKVYLYHGDTRLDNGRSLNSEGEVIFNLNMTIEEGDSETVWVKADMETVAGSATAGDQNRFEIRSADDVESSGDVSGSFPIRGALMEVGAQDIGTLEITAGGTDGDVKIGEDEVLVAEFDVEADSDDIHVTSIRLEQKGSIDMDGLSNFVLKRAGTTLAEGMPSGDHVVFEFESADEIEDGESVTYKVYADVGVADVDDTIQFVLDEDSDFNAWSEDNAGYEVGVTNTSLDTANAMELTVEGGKINVDLEGENQDVRADQNDAVFGTFTIVATAEDIDVDSLDFALHKNVNTFVLEDMKLRDKNGRGTFSLTAPAAIAVGDTSSTVRLENVVLNQGVTYEFELLGDVPETATSGYSYHFTWAAAGVEAEGVASDNAVTADDFSSASLTGPTIDVETSSLTVRSSALSDDTVVNGTKNVLLFRGTLEAGSTSDVTLTSMTFSTSTADNNDEDWDDRLDSVKLFVVGLNETVDPTEDVPAATDNTISSNQAVFDGLDVVVAKGSANRMKFEVYGDITDGSTTGDVNMELDDVDASDEDDEDVNAVNSSGTTIATGAPLLTDRLITIAGTGTLTITMDTDYPELKIDRYALAGTEKFLAGRVKLVANRENVQVNDLALNFINPTTLASVVTSATTTLDNAIDTVSLYSSPNMSDDSLLGTADFSATTTIEDVDYEVTDGSTQYVYVGLKLNSFGTAVDGTSASTSFRLAASVDVAGFHDVEGVSSGDDITPTVTARASGNVSEEVTVAPIKITNVWSDFAGGSLVGGNQQIFSFKVLADAGRNTDTSGDILSARLGQVTLILSTDVGQDSGGLHVSNTSALQLCRVDSGNCITLGVASGDVLSSTNTEAVLVDATTGTSSVNFAPFTDADEYVDDGETVEFVVKGTFANVTDKFAQIKIDNLDSSGLTYSVDTTDDGTADISYTDVRKDAPRGTDYPDVTGESLD